ncbi:helix-turn-helix domain-containing protein [Gilvimarinus sp. DA14]|uniref:helix-turn-helix domain-containing protein n=1 Tax=Gilvimarinus sp. DA14 TaxID=2956798 RepID=UPI0020B684A3|nr:helix-turn-helix domain-containing protein [Gilvimarinus sp. DA14]UTF60276.1 helix-turn-helix domain-containing protein [Gilvimarinus sp. DA14]
MTNPEKLSNSTHAQRTRLLAALESAQGYGITSYAANQELGIYHPPARIKELRQTGHNIATLWETIETDISRPRRVARYVLISKEAN